MNKIGFLAVAGLLAAAGSASAQLVANDYQLNLQLVPRTADINNVEDIAGPITLSTVGDKIRFHVRYFITDANGTNDGHVSAGLSSTSLTISSNIPASRGMFAAAELTDVEANGPSNAAPNGFTNPDTSGGSGDFGLNNPFRTGVFPQSNGDFTPVGGNLNIFNALPITTSAPNHRSDTQASRRWGVYSFEFTLTDNTVGTYTINLNGQGFLFFPRTTGGANLNGVNGNQQVIGSSFTFNVVPAPGAAALLGLGGLVAARRRRA